MFCYFVAIGEYSPAGSKPGESSITALHARLRDPNFELSLEVLVREEGGESLALTHHHLPLSQWEMESLVEGFLC